MNKVLIYEKYEDCVYEKYEDDDVYVYLSCDFCGYISFCVIVECR